MDKKIHSVMMLTLLLLGMLTLAFDTTPVRASIIVSDDFNDNTINSDLWDAGQLGGPTVDEINQRLEIFFPWDSAGAYFGAGYSSKCLLRGDFDMQVDFSLLDWPSVDQLGTGNGVRIGLAVGEGENWWSVQREGYGSLTFDFPGYPREVYACDFAGSVQGITPTDDMSGKLRLVRSGNTLTGYYFSLDSWVIVASGWVTTGDVSFSPTAWSHDYAFMDNNVLLAFDNFIVDSELLICEGRIIVPIDIKPGSDPNSIGLSARGLLPVAILSGAAFDATSINPATVEVGGVTITKRGSAKAQKLAYSFEDVNGDGFTDLIAFFSIPDLVDEGVLAETTITLTATLFDGTPIKGTDSVRVVPPPTIITVIGPWAGVEEEAFRTVLNAFTAETGIVVEYRMLSGQELVTLLQSEFEAETTPADAIFAWSWFIEEEGQEGHVLDVTNLINEADFSPGTLDPIRVGDTLYGGAYTGKVKPGFWYRKSFFAANGLTVPTTWDEFLALLDDMAAIPGIINPIVSGDGVGWPLSDATEHFLATFGGPQLHRDLTAGTVAWTSFEVRTIFADKLVPLLQGKFSTPIDWVTALYDWWNGEYGLYFMGSWITGMVDDPSDLDVFSLPGAEGLVFAADFFFIPTYTEHLDEAKQFFQFLASKEAQEIQAAQGGHIATNVNVPLDAYPPVDREVAEVMTGKETLFDLDDAIGGEFQTTFWDQLKLLWVSPELLDNVLEAIEAVAP